LTDFNQLFHVCGWLQQVLPQVLERRRFGTVAAVHRRDLSRPPGHSGDSHMIPATGKSTEQTFSHQVTHLQHLCLFSLSSTMQLFERNSNNLFTVVSF
jgi:hypothetical protein